MTHSFDGYPNRPNVPEQEYEQQQVDTDPYTIDSKYWQKDILHFAGGGTTIYTTSQH